MRSRMQNRPTVTTQMVAPIASLSVTRGSRAMAKNAPYGDGKRIGAVKSRSQTQTPSGHYVKRDSNTGRFMDVKTSSKTPFKGVRKEK